MLGLREPPVGQRRLVRHIGRQRWFAAAARLAPLDTRVLRASGGRFGLLGDQGLPQLVLTTNSFGQAHHPAWALKLMCRSGTRREINVFVLAPTSGFTVRAGDRPATLNG